MLKNASPLNDSYSCLVVNNPDPLKKLTNKKGLLARPLDFFHFRARFDAGFRLRIWKN